MEVKMYTVYSLIDPRDDLPFYIGITDDVYKRFAQHLKCNEPNLDKNERIQELKNENLMLLMRTLEVVETVEEAREREQHWIHHYLSKGARLLNIDIAHSFTFEDFQSFFSGDHRPKKPSIPSPRKATTDNGEMDIMARRSPLTIAEAAQVLGVSEEVIRKWKRSRKLLARAGGEMISASSVRKMLEN